MKRIKKLNFAKFQALLFALLGLVAGIIYSFGGLVYDAAISLGWLASESSSGISGGTLLAFGAIIGMPIIFAVIGFVLGLIEAMLYNIMVKFFKPPPMDSFFEEKK